MAGQKLRTLLDHAASRVLNTRTVADMRRLAREIAERISGLSLVDPDVGQAYWIWVVVSDLFEPRSSVPPALADHIARRAATEWRNIDQDDPTHIEVYFRLWKPETGARWEGVPWRFGH